MGITRNKSILQTPLHRLVIRYPRGHFLDKVYAFSRRMNPLDYDPTYPRNPATLAQYIRKYRKDKGLLIREFAEEIGVHKFTLIKWEGNKQVPRYKTEILKLMKAVPGVGRFLSKADG